MIDGQRTGNDGGRNKAQIPWLRLCLCLLCKQTANAGMKENVPLPTYHMLSLICRKTLGGAMADQDMLAAFAKWQTHSSSPKGKDRNIVVDCKESMRPGTDGQLFLSRHNREPGISP